MKTVSRALTETTMTDLRKNEMGTPKIADRATFQAQLDALRSREKAHTHEGDAIAADRRRLPMVEMDPTIKLTGPHETVTLLCVKGGAKLYQGSGVSADR